MQELNPSDLFEVRKMSLISELDFSLVLDFYVPIMGLEAFGVYEALAKGEKGRFKNHAAFFSYYQLSSGIMLRALAPLEALGLVKTYIKKNGSIREVLYCLYAPKTPEQFLGNKLLSGLLYTYLGQRDILEFLAKKYAINTNISEEYKEDSASFSEYFSDFADDEIFTKRLPHSGGRHSGTIKLDFDTSRFFNALEKENIFLTREDFSNRELVLIARLATFYKYSEEAIASFVPTSFNAKKEVGERINLKTLETLCEENNGLSYLKKEKIAANESNVHGQDPLPKMIRRMDKVPVLDFFVKLHHGNKPADSDLRILRELEVEMGLPAPAINALIFYVLVLKDESSFNRAYVTKLAGTLSRAGVKNALDALNLLQNTTRRHKKDVESVYLIKEDKQKQSRESIKTSKEELSDEEIDAFFDEE